MPFDFVSSVADFADFGDVGSLVDDFGGEFLTSDFSFTDFDIPVGEIADLGGYSEVGSFAGNADWFDTFNSGSILDSIPSVGDFNLGSITDSLPSLDSIKTVAGSVSDTVSAGYKSLSDSLPSLSSIKSTASTIAKDVQGYVKTAQSTIQAYQKVAPAVNAAASALGVQNPINSIIAPVSQAVGIAGSAAGIAAKAVDKVTGLPINTPREVDAYGLNILTNKEADDLIARNTTPGLVNSFAPAGAQQSESYNQAVATVESTTAALKQYDVDKASATAEISKTSDNIFTIQQRLEDPATTDEERAVLESQLSTEYDNLALAQQSLEQTNTAITQVSAARDQAVTTVENTVLNTTNSAAAVGGQVVNQYAMIKNTDGTYSILDRTNGDTVQSGLSEASALTQIRELNIATPGITVNNTTTADSPFNTLVGAAAALVTNGTATTAQNSITAALTSQARAQQSVRSLRNNKAQSGDWRVRLRLAPNSTYLYNNTQLSILQPLNITDGVIFPYTPTIETAYKANYETYDLTHSNYRGYFYKNSYVDAVNIRATFTAQDTKEADYLLAVIHFFRSCTKMFYGNDTERGAPPQLVFLSGYGDYQFNEHPSVVTQFNYSLPPDVDYIRCQSTLSNNTNQLNARLRNPIANNPLSYSVNRLLNSSLFQGALNNSPFGTANNLDSAGPTYVPTKMEISISLLPVQSRSNISNNFSVKEFSNGNLLKGGFW